MAGSFLPFSNKAAEPHKLLQGNFFNALSFNRRGRFFIKKRDVTIELVLTH